MPIRIRDFDASEAARLNTVGRAAGAEFEPVSRDFAGLARRLGEAARLAGTLEPIVGASTGTRAGAVGYVPPQAAQEVMFAPEWVLIRVLSVAPRPAAVESGDD